MKKNKILLIVSLLLFISSYQSHSYSLALIEENIGLTD